MKFDLFYYRINFKCSNLKIGNNLNKLNVALIIEIILIVQLEIVYNYESDISKKESYLSSKK